MANRRIENIIVHWSATSDPSLGADDIRQMHLNKGWRDVGYHRLIVSEKSKEYPANLKGDHEWYYLVKTGRDLDDDLFIEQNEIGAHTLYHNGTSVGVCVLAGPNLRPSVYQKEALLRTCLILCNRFKLLPNAVKVHRDFNTTECPGDEIANWIKDYFQSN